MANLLQTSEGFKDIPGYEGLYKISADGKIILSYHWSPQQGRQIHYWVHVSGYCIIQLTKESVTKSWRVHRLVGLAHLPNTENKPFINHKDGNKQNNHKDNLEWSTKSENELHAFANGLKRRMFGERPWMKNRGRKRVKQRPKKEINLKAIEYLKYIRSLKSNARRGAQK